MPDDITKELFRVVREDRPADVASIVEKAMATRIMARLSELRKEVITSTFKK